MSGRKLSAQRARRGRSVMSKALVLGAAALALSAAGASAQVYVSPGYGYGYGYGAPLYDYAAPSYGYAATAPLYDYAAPAVTSGYYNYAPGYWGGYGRWRAGYGWR